MALLGHLSEDWPTHMGDWAATFEGVGTFVRFSERKKERAPKVLGGARVFREPRHQSLPGRARASALQSPTDGRARSLGTRLPVPSYSRVPAEEVAIRPLLVLH